ncbi:two component, sigma54 specific, transcriptional regulator, Fis family protein [Plesiocystis pacifica SIR-1]|uniref:Two component, sigma54 specific, transcriptional regulator, Fis family protein n=1 Tax=Plesiocystis pacifica SIR-1 TaxID=391625 RepID=A6GHB1_9BACT|nr:sigma-54 dependent transcriptional regulator [Plesiocystis pacifica]EDM74726.1 two component, sigma54 specific, transcriptional regulator, Fis family protein [Plesiocystis pacifica SIR-1]
MSEGFSNVLVVDDEEPMRHMLELLLRRAGFEVVSVESGEQALAHLAEHSVDVVLSDVRMPGLGGLGLAERMSAEHPEVTLVMMSAFGTVDLALEAMQRGAYDYVSKPFKRDEVVLTLRKAEERLRLRRENAQLRARLAEFEGGVSVIGKLLIHSAPMRKLAATLRKVARFETTVLILGESGVGKELVCRALHELGPRSGGPFIALNCGAIPEGLLESELFGHAKGAFTDATRDKAGLFEAAEAGTLFLDEVGELPVSVQVKLLRALQEREVRRVGETDARPVDVRVVAATSRPLEEMVEASEFRRDLFYRLAVMPLSIPPLRERREDIAPLTADILEAINRRLGTTIEGLDAEALRILQTYDWPGNVRELENTLEHAAVLTEGALISPRSLPQRLHRERPGADAAPADDGKHFHLEFSIDDLSVKRAAHRIEHELISRALDQTGGNRTHAAKLLELSHRALLYKIKDYGVG